jgi:hypothetical protein
MTIFLSSFVSQPSVTSSLQKALGQPRQPQVSASGSQSKILHLESLPHMLATIAWAFGLVKFYHKIWGKMTQLLIDHPDILRRMDPEVKSRCIGSSQSVLSINQLFQCSEKCFDISINQCSPECVHLSAGPEKNFCRIC